MKTTGKQYTYFNITLTETRRKDGRYMATGRDPITLRPKPSYSRIPGEAAKAAAKTLARLDEKTLGAYYLNVFLPSVQQREPAWRQQIRWAWDMYLMPTLADKPLDSIKRADLQRLFNRIALKLRPTSVRRIKIVAGCIFNLALVDELITTNPCAKLRLPEDTPRPKRTLSFYDLSRLINKTSGAMQNAVILLGHGLRIGEACALSVGHLQNGAMKVEQQLTQDDGGGKIKKKLKTKQSVRSIPIAPEVEAILRANAGTSLYLIPAVNGKPMLPKNVSRELKALLAKIGDVPTITPHELRHTFITLLENELEAPHPVVCALSGKSLQSVTAQYNHVHERVMRKWSELYWQTIQGQTQSGEVVRLA